jgi:hypothetical protein
MRKFRIIFVLLFATQLSLVALTYFGTTSTPVDMGTHTADLTPVTPPANMQAGDLVLFYWSKGCGGCTGGAIFTTGGQTWSSCGSLGLNSLFCSYAIFNGTWTADPAYNDLVDVDTFATGVIHVFRPVSGGTWTLDVAGSCTTYTNQSTVQIDGVTRSGPGVAIAVWWTGAAAGTAISWGSLSGAGWEKTGMSAQYRNQGGTDHSGTFAYNIGDGATGNVTQVSSNSISGSRCIVAFKETAPVGPPLGSRSQQGHGR